MPETRPGGAVEGGDGLSEPRLEVRRLALTKADFAKHQFTVGCAGCDRMRLGRRAQGHSEACRLRMEHAISQDEDGRERVERAKRRLDQAYYEMTRDQVEGGDGQAGGEGDGAAGGCGCEEGR